MAKSCDFYLLIVLKLNVSFHFHFGVKTQAHVLHSEASFGLSYNKLKIA